MMKVVSRRLAHPAVIAICVIGVTTVRADDEGRKTKADRYGATNLVSDIAGQRPAHRPGSANGRGVVDARRAFLFDCRQRH